MIKFVLRCPRGHEFESWFQSGDAFNAQARSGLIACPLCQSTGVSKAVMAPAVASRTSAWGASPFAPQTSSQSPAALLGKHDRETRALFNAIRKRVFEVAEDVGVNFAEEARKIHAGLVPERPIHGTAKYGDARELIEEGVAIFPLPPALDDFN
jgi:hypothetical protein